MHAIEFETTAYQHTIRLPEGVPEGVMLRVLLLSPTPFSVPPVIQNFKTLFANVVEGMTDNDLKRSGVSLLNPFSAPM